MQTDVRLHIAEIEEQVCDVTSDRLGIPRQEISPVSRLIEDLGCDSLGLVDLLMSMEEAFGVTLMGRGDNDVSKSIFTRSPFRLSDLAEVIYLQQGMGVPDRIRWRRPQIAPPSSSSVPFTQLEGRYQGATSDDKGLFEAITKKPTPQFRRRTDGMRCVQIPAARVEIGCNSAEAPADERQVHTVDIDSFLIDAEPVSTTAFCRFLNSTGEPSPGILADWFVLDALDKRVAHMLIENGGTEWRPVPGAEKLPMMLVSWYGANAYSLWANGRMWCDYRDDCGDALGSFLPTEAQWEYAARGPLARTFPWGDSPPTADMMRYGQHRRSTIYDIPSLPLAAVNDQLGMSPFGLHHMAGNVWQWCRDWYDESFYQKLDATEPNPIHRTPTGVRSERGGSWIGPADLCRSSYRRGRNPLARGRCLGFRCVSLTISLR